MSKLYVIGMGPGGPLDMTFRARAALEESDCLVGYTGYIDLLRQEFAHKELLQSGMRQETARCQMALELAAEGKTVSLVSSGDSGIYGMAGLALELAAKDEAFVQVEVAVIPGITAASAGAALLGAPIIHDFAVISLSDLLTPWEKIEKRLECAAEGDFVVCIYNPKSKKRQTYIEVAREILLRHRSPQTPVGIVRNIGREGEEAIVTTLQDMLTHPIDMTTTVLIGNSQTYVASGKIITPRGYRI